MLSCSDIEKLKLLEIVAFCSEIEKLKLPEIFACVSDFLGPCKYHNSWPLPSTVQLKITNKQKKVMVLLPLPAAVEYVLINVYRKPHVCN